MVSLWEDRNASVQFDAVAKNHYMVLQNGLTEYLNKLLSLRALFDSSDDGISRRAFEGFARPHLQSSSAIQTLSWVPRVRHDERAAYEAAAARDGIEGYQFKAKTADDGMAPSNEQDEYYPIFYSTVPKTSPLYGLDLRSEPPTLAELERARDDDQLGFTSRPALVSAGGRQHGYIFSLPVYRQGSARGSAENRRRNLVGFVHGSFITAKMIETILDATTVPAGLDLFFFEPESAPNVPPLYVHGSRLRDAPIEPKFSAARGAGPRWSRNLIAGNSPWMTLVAAPMPGGPLTTRHDRAWIVLICGLIITGGVAIYLSALARHTHHLTRANAKISELAQTDALTALANRRAFTDRLSTAFAAGRRGSAPFALHCFDLDNFKDVNDTLGHPAGDALLRQVANRVKSSMRGADLFARFGGDEFAVLQTNIADLTAAGTLAAKIGQFVAAPYLIEGNEVRVTASIGISCYTPQIAGPEAMMTQADLALYRAKEDGRNCFRFHSEELDGEVEERVTLGHELRGALERGELGLFYQPQVELVSGKIIGLEALMRWNHPVRGFIPPSVFIPIAERTGSILPLGRWAFDEACRQLKVWHAQGNAPALLAVNFSTLQFKSPSDIEREIVESLTRHGIAPDMMEIELTESVLMAAAQQQSDCFERLRHLGMRIAIDDFGIGYSSLNYLTSYPVNRLKIAQELVFKVDSEFRNATVVRAAIRLARELGIECIAEGVETEAQARFLVSAGCEHGQGYYFSRPVDAARATELLRQGRIKPARDLLCVVATSAA
jgi:diguanylate cyclase (GGDEF)-like protein